MIRSRHATARRSGTFDRRDLSAREYVRSTRRTARKLYRVALNARRRIGTGEPYSRNKIFDNSTGYGQPGAILGAATDVRFTPRVFLTAIGSYTMQFGTRDVARIANAGNSILPLRSLPGRTAPATKRRSRSSRATGLAASFRSTGSIR